MSKRKETEGFNLAFLDIMSCGLGAVILVFMLVKTNVEETTATTNSEVEKLQSDINRLSALETEKLKSLNDLSSSLDSEIKKQNALKNQLASVQSKNQTESQQIKSLNQELEKLKSSIKDIEVKKQSDLVQTETINEENYLLGLKVEGRKIAILVDSSASMTHELLIDIIKVKNGSDQEKKNAEKWLRTKRIVQWLLARAPKSSEVVVIHFNETAGEIGKPGWKNASDPSTVGSILSQLETIVPTGGTNLQIGLEQLKKYAPSNLYVITDGLPTKGQSRYKSLNPFANCSSLRGSSNTISGECRIKRFRQTLQESSQQNVKTNIILLPIEGDPGAINEYWNWSAATGGLLISPALNWP